MQHDVGVDAADVGLAEALVPARLGDDREVLDLVHHWPGIVEAMGRLDAVVDRLQEQILAALVAVECQPTKVEHGVIKIPGIDCVGVLALFLADARQVAAQRLELLVVELRQAAQQFGFERMLLAVPAVPFVDRLRDRKLHHDVGIFALRIGHDVQVAVLVPPCLARGFQIPDRAVRPGDPVPILGYRQVERLVGDAEHLHELPRHFLLVVASPVSNHQDRPR
jgi:hypothetical protein